MSEWQPIGTAPKDGTEFLAYDASTNKMDVAVMSDWFDLGWVCRPVQSDCELGPSDDEFGYDLRGPTHWMPLPDPPGQ